VDVGGSVLPGRLSEGIGTALLGALLTRVDELHAQQRPDLEALVAAGGLASGEERRALLADAGFAEDRWSFGMRTTLDAVPEPSRLPEGYTVAVCDDELAARMRQAHNAAFTGHLPGFTPWTERRWEQHVTGSRSFRRDVSFVALQGEEIVGYVQSAEWESYFDATGRREAYVGKVGVVPEHRGRGIAGALLGRALQAYRDAGYDEAALDVDSQNPTGALGIYERAGFEVETRWVSFVLIRPALR
jgi:ribosomal protein S18 acetylase RimI-like enzyme